MDYDVLKTIAIDITYSIFEGEKLAILYITNDSDSLSYIVAVPTIHLVKQIWDGNEESGYDSLLQSDIGINHPAQKEKLVEIIKQAIESFD